MNQLRTQLHFMSAACLATCLYGVVPVGAQCLENLGLQQGSRSAIGDGCGTALSVDGDWMAVGAPYADAPADRSGLVYIFRRVGPRWVEDAVLSNPNGHESDHLGQAVSISGNRVLVGVPSADLDVADAGAVAVFVYDGNRWTPEALLTSPDDHHLLDNFGSTVRLVGDDAYIGMPSSDAFGDNAGGVYQFHFDGSQWNHVRTIIHPDALAHDYFGTSIDVTDDLMIVGANSTEGNAATSGAAFIFRSIDGQWEFQQKVFATDGESGDRFGTSVAIGPDWALVGAPQEDEARGAAYLFRRDGDAWSQAARIESPDRNINATFGQDVAMDGDRATISDPGTIRGAGWINMYRFDGQQWSIERYLHDIDTWYDNYFGSAHALDAGTLVVRATYKPSELIRFDGFCIFDRNGRCGPKLTVDARCTSESSDITLRWSDATPSGQVAIVMSPGRGFFYIPNNYPCAGQWLGLDPVGAQIVYRGYSGPNGGKIMDRHINSRLCGTYLQLIDLTTCVPSNVCRFDQNHDR